MNQDQSSLLRNLAIVGHGDAGKTSFVSALLFTNGTTNRLFRVDDGNTISDFDDDEVKRNISISTALCCTSWKKHKINILDTPGYSDFICDAFPALRSADVAVLLVNAGTGFEFNLERIWEAGDQIPKSRVFIINKLDRENTSFEKAISSIKENLSEKIIPIAIPIGTDASFSGIIDLLDNKALRFDETGKAKAAEIPAELADQVEDARMALIEAIAESDDKLLEKYLEGEDITPDELKHGFKTGITQGTFYPAIPFSAASLVGSSYFLDFCINYLPSPVDVEPRVLGDLKVECDAEKPFIAQVFKTIIDPYSGKISVFRIYSGTLTPDSTLRDTTQQENEKISTIFSLQGKTQKPMTAAIAGDIAAVAKLRYGKTGDTLCSPDQNVIIDPISYPDPLMALAFTPMSKNDEEKISVSLTRLSEEDPTLRYERNSETNQLIVSGMGSLHLDVTQDRLKRKYGVTASTAVPKIPYRETIKGTADVRYRHKKQSGGAGQFGEVAIRLLPLPEDEGDEERFLFDNKIVGGVIPGQYIPSVEKGIRSTMEKGILAGFKVMNIKVELYDGKSHPVDSKDIAFQIAGAQALKQAFLQAKPILLEPIMKIGITVPENAMGDVIGDLNSKRGRVQGMDSKGNKQIIRATVPMSEIQMYEPELRSMTGGRGSYSMEFDHYEELPSQLTDAVVAQYKKEE